jgi:hypothetical protein
MGLKGSVGEKSGNHPSDVASVRALLNFHILFNPSMKQEIKATLPILGGGPMGDTITAIRAFQLYVLNGRATGRIEPGDTTYKALIGKVEGMPVVETLAPARDRLHNKLTQLLHDDLRDVYLAKSLDPAREAGLKPKLCILNKLLLPDVDDAFLAEATVWDYVNKDQPGIRLGGPIKESSAKGYLIQGMKTTRSMEAFARLISDLYEKEILGALQELNKATSGESGSQRYKLDGTLSELYMATTNVQEWIVQHNKNRKSIYSCLTLNILG